MLDRAETSPTMLTPAAAKILVNMLTSKSPALYADADAAIVASVTEKLARNLVANFVATTEDIDTTMGYLEAMCVFVLRHFCAREVFPLAL
jgi:hypothetical protein